MNSTGEKEPFARETALAIMYRVDQKGAYANLELNKVLDKDELTGRDRALITELVYGCLRMQGAVDYILGLFVSKPLSGLPAWILLILRLGVYQIIYLDKVPNRAAVNESVNLAKKYGHPGTVKLVNGVLRNIARHKDQIEFPAVEKNLPAHISAAYSHPEWLVKRWLEQFGPEETLRLCAADNQAPPVKIRTNTLRITPDQLRERLGQEGVLAHPGPYVPESLILEGVVSIASLPSFREGLFQVQDEGSMLVAYILDAKPDSKVIDACAAPGGKTTHIAQRMSNRGMIKAYDIYPHKLALVEESCRRLGIDMVEICPGDATALSPDLDEWADYVLVDAPCSGLGVLGRRPDARWKKNESQIQELAQIQKQILSAAAKTVRSGGVLVYSTCTVSPEENESVVRWFLDGHPDYEPAPFSQLLPFPLADRDRVQGDRGMMQLLPHVHGTDGLFIARLSRRERGK